MLSSIAIGLACTLAGVGVGLWLGMGLWCGKDEPVRPCVIRHNSAVTRPSWN